MGNKADVSGNDLLSWWAEDDATSVGLLYLESFGNPRRFARLARELSRSKPVIAVKAAGARSDAGPPRLIPPRWPAPTRPSPLCSTRPA